MDSTEKVFVAGHRGLVGRALVRALEASGHEDILTAGRDQLDLLDQSATARFFAQHRPDIVLLAAARVGGILANDTRGGEFIYENLMMQSNVIHASHINGARKLLFLGSTCIYPRLAPQPLSEDALLTGELEPTNEPYAIAKIAGIKMCQAYRRQYGSNFISVMPTNLYGPYDNFDLESSHVMPALIAKFHTAKTSGAAQVVVWGTGKPKREFCHVDDMAAACLFLVDGYDRPEIVNIGVGEDISILELSQLVARVVGYEGALVHDLSKPDGTPRKLVDVSRLFGLGWRPSITLERGVADTYEWYKANVADGASGA